MQHICTTCYYCNERPACDICDLAYAAANIEKITDRPRKQEINLPDQAPNLPFDIEQTKDGTAKVSHPYIHCKALNLHTLLRIACASDAKIIDANEEIATSMINTASLLLYKQDVTPLDLASHLSNTTLKELPIPFHIYDARKSHFLAYEDLFRHFQQGALFIADIHDLTHHGAQTLNWGSFVQKLGTFGVSAFRNGDTRQQGLATFLLFACLEYAIIQGPRHSYSAGCLNWQGPKKSLAETATYRPMCAQCITSWNSLRGLRSLRRRLDELSQNLNEPLFWLSDLGYSKNADDTIDLFPHKYTPIAQVSGPKSVKDLLLRGEKLMEANS